MIEIIENAPKHLAVISYADVFPRCYEVNAEFADYLIANGATLIPETGIEDMSDGYHTFKDLYYQRMMLTAALVKAYKPLSWKSHRHEDGELCFGGGWFIVGITTPQGDYTYHYEESYWSLFDCEELPKGKPWDGHTEKDVTRLLSLASDNNAGGKWIPVSERLPSHEEDVLICFSDGYVCDAYYDVLTEEWIKADEMPVSDRYVITHWMPLPEPPKEEA